MTDCKKRSNGTNCHKLEAIMFGYLLIVAMFCVYDYNNFSLLFACLLLLLPIKIISTWFQDKVALEQADFKGDIADLIAHLGLSGLAPKTISLNSYFFSTNLRIFPNSWCIVMQKEDRHVLIGVNGLIRKLSKSASGIKLIEKSNVSVKNNE